MTPSFCLHVKSKHPFQNFIDDPGAHGDQHNVAPCTAPFVARVMRQPPQGTIIQTLTVIAVRQWSTTHQMNTWRRGCPAYKIAVVIVNSLAHRAEVPCRRPPAMVFRRGPVGVATV